ncbi:MAG: hypothetical protein PPP58_04270 [Natronomonas sp.]
MPRSKRADDRDTTWLDVADDVIDESVRREEAIEITVEDLEVDVPLSFGADAEHLEFRFDGSVSVQAEGAGGPLYAWIRWWETRSE